MNFANANKLDRKSGGSPRRLFSKAVRPLQSLNGRPVAESQRGIEASREVDRKAANAGSG
jgi:hypothetical protein